MYYNDYEDYMRNILGYSGINSNTYDFQDRANSASNIEQMYPEIYKVINPMVCKMCDSNTQPVTEYLIEQMTDDIYDNVVNRIEIQNVINVNIGTRDYDNENEEKNLNRGENSNNRSSVNNLSSRSNGNTLNSNINSSSTKPISYAKPKEDIEENRETRSPHRQRRNMLLRDLIRILLLNRLIRPERPPRPPRPCYGGQCPGIPGRPGQYPRPPMPRTDYYPYM